MKTVMKSFAQIFGGISKSVRKNSIAFLALMLVMLSNITVYAQGSAGLDAATTELLSYMKSLGDLILAIGAVVGMVGGVRVYTKWNAGDQDVNKAVMGWMGSCLFLVLVGTVIKSFFGI
ncbi:DUF4134 domain-containing protein [Persicobacter diffluens]|uniref:DUF4134 domain-containing protein n=1 Tax=Persicobacter diffluens TaxID=981 RepID=A0AAN5AMU3_9BACT|nr:hypothetical protein PEDI_51710 [Persicobacter diffluens]GJM64809.1 hypothetical protein PEDI_53610 [Persicobacter diffluens]